MGWPEYVALATGAERAGFDSIWVGDHLLYRADNPNGPGVERGPWDAWSILAGLAAVTSRVSLGPLVACAAFHPPGLLARLAATVDMISGGRLVLGLGAGWNEEEFRAFGLPFDNRVSRFEESFEIIRLLLSGERVSLDGRYCSVDDAVLLPPPRRRPPLMVGSSGERMLAITLPFVDTWNTWFDEFGNTPEGFADLNAKVTAAAEGVGRPPGEVERSACVFVVVDRDAPERPIWQDVPPLEGGSDQIASGLRQMAEAGADEAIAVVSPINERSIQTLGEMLALLDLD